MTDILNISRQLEFSALDRFDRAILLVLAQEGRISVTELAKRIGLSKLLHKRVCVGTYDRW